MDYDKVVLVAGGTGATFTFGLAADMIWRLSPDSNKQIDFIWVSRHRGMPIEPHTVKQNC